jgi:hypothetical protein
MNNIDSNNDLDKGKILFLLEQLDQKAKEPYDIVICGGAAAIAQYGVDRFTSDIDILGGSFESASFKDLVSDVLIENNFDLKTINSGANVYSKTLNPNFQKRLVLSDVEFKNLRVSFISKADLVSMKLSALRERDIDDINILGISVEDLPVIDENLAHLVKHDPVQVLIMKSLLLKREDTQKIKGIEPFVGILKEFFEKEEVKSVLDSMKSLDDVLAKPESFSDFSSVVSKIQSEFLADLGDISNIKGSREPPKIHYANCSGKCGHYSGG